jgi:excisionase family DNA binding protein
MDPVRRQHRHDEAWQNAVVDGMARMMDVLHDISDGVRQIAEATSGPTTDARIAPSEGQRPMLSVDELAELLGVSGGSVRSLRWSGKGPIATKIGGRVLFQRNDVDAWLEQRREVSDDQTRPWRDSYVPGRIVSSVPQSSEPARRAYCSGSHTEPMAASRFSGRAVCPVCRDDVLVNRDGLLRTHYPRGW